MFEVNIEYYIDITLANKQQWMKKKKKIMIAVNYRNTYAFA